MNCRCFIDDKISFICNNEYNYFLSKANVVGVGSGYKVKNGFLTGQQCITVFVSHKYQKNLISNKDLIPSVYKNIPVDVVESGEFIIEKYRIPSSTSNPFRKRVRPVLGGYSIGVAKTLISGTMGCLVTDTRDNFILSCNHVLADLNKLPLGSFIIQPSENDGGKSPQDIVAFLSEYVPLSTSVPNDGDCAIAKVMNKQKVSSKIGLVGTPKAVIEPKYGYKVKKVGEATGLTKGKIIGVKTVCKARLEGKDFLFKNQVVTSPMTEAGDSGAVLLNEQNYTIALIAGGNKTTSFGTPMSDVLRLLNVLLVTS